MSHNIIVELSEDKIESFDRMCAYDLEEDDDIQYAADYVQDIEDSETTYEEAVQILINDLGPIATYDEKDNSITFHNVESFFKVPFTIFKEKVAAATLEDFMKSSWSYDLRNQLDPIFGTYIHHTNDCSYSLPEFVRDFVKDGAKFYIGGICDYHC